MWLLVLGLLLTALAIYQPAWHGGILWDDDYHVTRPEFHSWQGLYRIWFDVRATLQYYPLLHSTFWLEHKLWGDATLGYHLVNILMHVAAALMLALILRRLSIPGAWLAAAVFALHPVHAESVAWISELKNTLSTVFYLGALMLYLRFDETRKRSCYVGALFIFILALLSKTVTGTLPGALLVVFWWQRGRLSWRKDVLPLVPFFVLGAGGGMITAWWELDINHCVGPDFQFSILDRFLIAGRAVWFHLSKLFWPADLAFIYPRWQINSDVWWQYLFPLGGAALLAALWSIRRWSRAPLAGVLFFCGTLFPTLGFFNLYTFRYSLVANHYQYLASASIIALVMAAAIWLLERLGLRHRGIRYGLCVLLLTTLSVLTWRQSHQYADAETLYRTTLRLNPSCWMAHVNLGILESDRNIDKAIAHFKDALRIKPDLAEAHNNLGLTSQAKGRLDDALMEYNEALRLDPGYAEAHSNLGNALMLIGRLEEAAAQCREALTINPDNSQAHYHLGNVLQREGSFDEALAQYAEALRLNPNLAEAYNNRGFTLQALERIEEAMAQYNEALRLKPAYAEAHYNLGNALQRMGRLEEAIPQYREALRLKPACGEAYHNLGAALQGMGRPEEALMQYREALRLKPDFAEARNSMGAALQALGRLKEAAREYEEALRLKSDYADAHYNLANTLQVLGYLDEAVGQYNETIRYRPADSEAYNNLGTALERLGRFSEAVAEYKKALQIQPGLAEAIANLARAQALLKNAAARR